MTRVRDLVDDAIDAAREVTRARDRERAQASFMRSVMAAKVAQDRIGDVIRSIDAG